MHVKRCSFSSPKTKIVCSKNLFIVFLSISSAILRVYVIRQKLLWPNSECSIYPFWVLQFRNNGTDELLMGGASEAYFSIILHLKYLILIEFLFCAFVIGKIQNLWIFRIFLCSKHTYWILDILNMYIK